MNKSIKTIIALTALFVIGFLALEGCNKKEAQQPKVSGYFVSGCNDVVLHRDNELNDTIYATAVDDTKLKISTTNTQFSCGVDTILDIIIENLKLGQTYSVSIKKDERDYFQFEVTFGSDTNLMFVRGQ